MKKLLLFLLLPCLCFAQDMAYAESLNNLTWKQTQEVADDISSTFTVSIKYYGKYNDNQDMEVLMYYPSDLPERIIKEDAEKPYCELCTEFKFRKIHIGANSDLGIDGTLVYSLNYTSGKYLDLYAWWEKHFAPGISKADLIEDKSGKRYIEDRSKRINLRFTKQLNKWDIRNFN